MKLTEIALFGDGGEIAAVGGDIVVRAGGPTVERKRRSRRS